MGKTAILVVLWATVIWRSPAIRRPGGSRSLWLALACLALALTYDLPVVIRGLDDATGVTDLATLVKQVLGVAAIANLLDWMVASVEPEYETWYLGQRRRIAFLTALGLVALFFCAPRRETAEFAATAAGNAWATAYLVLFEAYLAAAMAFAAGMFATTWRNARSRFLRTGVAMLVVGTTAGVIYAVTRSIVLALSLIHGTSIDGATATSLTDEIQVAAIALILIGLAVPPCEPGWRRAQTIWKLIDLRPLWSEVVFAAPGIKQRTPATLREDLTEPEAGLRVMQRVSEIHDSVNQLREYVPASHWHAVGQLLDAAGLTGREKDATASACWVATAVRVKTQDVPVPDPAELPDPRGGMTVEEDLAWLRAVAKARRTRLFAQIDAHLMQVHPSTTPLRKNTA
jgi:hypothetical protein